MKRRNKTSLILLSIVLLAVLSLLAFSSTKADLTNPCSIDPYPVPDTNAAYPYPYPYPYPEPEPSCNFIPVLFKNW